MYSFPRRRFTVSLRSTPCKPIAEHFANVLVINGSGDTRLKSKKVRFGKMPKPARWNRALRAYYVFA
jgi:hypothetical protein